ncbi:MAG: bifunctional riboflavin kinase/FAD synthetase [Mesorhizobium amorphae]|nr:MAG: bifunctional riboflavin kinase/FAD synthetase [Mesorhizobium amorphae]
MGRTFRRIAGSANLPPDLRGAVVAIGNFDGVHRGHQAVLEAAMERGAREKRPVLVLTFAPHPRRWFQPDAPHFTLTPPAMKARLLEALGLDAVVEQPFDGPLANLSAEDFVRDILVEQLGAHAVLTGFDFHFGRGRGGDPQFLAEAGERLGFAVETVSPFSDEGGAVVSSSRIRERLAQGEVSEAAGLLNYRWTTEGTVDKGRQLGRTLGYPTANMALPKDTGLRHGIFAVRFRRADGALHDGVASFGRRPTVEEDGRPLLETYLFDFSGDLYGETCSVSLFGFLRPEERFESLDALTVQMKRDEAEARALLSGVRPFSALDGKIAF